MQGEDIGTGASLIVNLLVFSLKFLQVRDSNGKQTQVIIAHGSVQWAHMSFQHVAYISMARLRSNSAVAACWSSAAVPTGIGLSRLSVTLAGATGWNRTVNYGHILFVIEPPMTQCACGTAVNVSWATANVMGKWAPWFSDEQHSLGEALRRSRSCTTSAYPPFPTLRPNCGEA